MMLVLDIFNYISQDEAELEMKRLKLELKQTMEMYSTACKEALTAKQKVYICPDLSHFLNVKNQSFSYIINFPIGNGTE